MRASPWKTRPTSPRSCARSCKKLKGGRSHVLWRLPALSPDWGTSGRDTSGTGPVAAPGVCSTGSPRGCVRYISGSFSRPGALWSAPGRAWVGSPRPSVPGASPSGRRASRPGALWSAPGRAWVGSPRPSVPGASPSGRRASRPGALWSAPGRAWVGSPRPSVPGASPSGRRASRPGALWSAPGRAWVGSPQWVSARCLSHGYTRL